MSWIIDGDLRKRELSIIRHYVVNTKASFFTATETASTVAMQEGKIVEIVSISSITKENIKELKLFTQDLFEASLVSSDQLLTETAR